MSLLHNGVTRWAGPPALSFRGERGHMVLITPTSMIQPACSRLLFLLETMIFCILSQSISTHSFAYPAVFIKLCCLSRAFSKTVNDWYWIRHRRNSLYLYLINAAWCTYASIPLSSMWVSLFQVKCCLYFCIYYCNRPYLTVYYGNRPCLT